jgi:hypothetical protein
MTSRDPRTPIALAFTAGLLAGCSAVTDSGPLPSAPPSPPETSIGSSPSSEPAPALLDDLLAARTAGDPRRFATLVSQAAASCTDPAASRQLGQLSAVAERWADAIAFARPKAQARTEAQLAEVDWAAVLADC